ncbi:MAG: hypothetical protein IT285_13360 [Bdellovibrionales bacterium]|nr:hypothetical protein [Bdellovibrionales bacterium]
MLRGRTRGGVLKEGPAMRVVFFYPGEEGSYVENAYVTVFENGIVHLQARNEETTAHLQNCEVLWDFELEADDRTSSKIRLLKPKKGEGRGADLSVDADADADPDDEGAPDREPPPRHR